MSNTRGRMAALGAAVLLLLGSGVAVASVAAAPVSIPCTQDGRTVTCTITPVTTTRTTTRTVTVTSTVTGSTTSVPSSSSSGSSSQSSSSSTSSTSPTSTSTPPPPTGFPDGSTTGPTGILASSGGITATTDGQVIQNLQINGCLVIKANNVVVRNVLIKSAGCFFMVLNDSGNTGLTLTDVEIDGAGNNAATGIGGRNWTALRIDIHGTGDGLKLGDNTSITDSYIHDLAGVPDDHNDGMQASDGTNITVRHNSILIGLKSATSAILVKSDFGPISNVTIDNNLMAGGAYTLYAGETGNDGSAVTNVKVTNNLFSTRYWPKGGFYGPITSIPAGAVVTNNSWADGQNAGGGVS